LAARAGVNYLTHHISIGLASMADPISGVLYSHAVVKEKVEDEKNEMFYDVPNESVN